MNKASSFFVEGKYSLIFLWDCRRFPRSLFNQLKGPGMTEKEEENRTTPTASEDTSPTLPSASSSGPQSREKTEKHFTLSEGRTGGGVIYIYNRKKKILLRIVSPPGWAIMSRA
jgi:hypothetical protein